MLSITNTKIKEDQHCWSSFIVYNANLKNHFLLYFLSSSHNFILTPFPITGALGFAASLAGQKKGSAEGTRLGAVGLGFLQLLYHRHKLFTKADGITL